MQLADWEALELQHATMATQSKKLAALQSARNAGLSVPDGIVLLRLPSDQATRSIGKLNTPAVADRIDNLARLGNSRLVLRSIGNTPAKSWRRRIRSLGMIELAIAEITKENPTEAAIFLQTCWHAASQVNCRKIHAIIRFAEGEPRLAHAYQISASGTVATLCYQDQGWSALSKATVTLARAIGTCVQAVFGSDGSTLTLLSVVRAPISLAHHLEAAAISIPRCDSERAAAVAVVDDALDAIGSSYLFVGNDRPAMPMRGRSIGESWATGRVAFSPPCQAKILAAGDPVILVRPILRVEDCALFQEAAGIVSVADGISSHFALLASSMRKPCLVDVAGARIIEDQSLLKSGDLSLKEGDWAIIDERQSVLLPGRALPVREPVTMPPSVLSWAHNLRADQLLVNCEDPAEAAVAVASGADGIGLCRSERHLVASPIGLAALQRVVTSTDEHLRADATRLLCQELGLALENLLAAIPGKQISYRLLEPAELLLGAGPVEYTASDRLKSDTAATTHAMLRGEAFRNRYPFLYEAQIRAAIGAADSVAQRLQCIVDLSIIVPMISDVAEYKRWQNVIRTSTAELTPNSASRVSIRVGVMIETPRAAMFARELAGHSDAFLVGTNDLTALVWGLDRFGTYRSNGSATDPFARFDAAGVGRLLTQATHEARAANPNLTITICGSHASVRHDADMLLDTGADGLSCQIDAIPRMALQLARRTERLSGHIHTGLPSKSAAARCFADTLASARKSRADARSGTPPAVIDSLAEWAREIAEDLSLARTGIWKFFKRDLIARWFGPRESHRFMPGWQIEQALQCALSLAAQFDTRIRYSVFPADIACRASSDVFPIMAARDTWFPVLERLDANVAVEIFPQQPINRTAFRAVLRDMLLSIEGAPGQAIDIFWKAPQPLSKFVYDGCTGEILHLTGAFGFDELFKPYLSTFFAQCRSLCDYLGAEWISLEGYAGPAVEAPLFIADLDLPLDGFLIGSSRVGGT